MRRRYLICWNECNFWRGGRSEIILETFENSSDHEYYSITPASTNYEKLPWQYLWTVYENIMYLYITLVSVEFSWDEFLMNYGQSERVKELHSIRLENLKNREKSGNLWGFWVIREFYHSDGKKNVAHERFPYSFTSIQKKISCLEVWKKQGKVRENDRDEKMASLQEIVGLISKSLRLICETGRAGKSWKIIIIDLQFCKLIWEFSIEKSENRKTVCSCYWALRLSLIHIWRCRRSTLCRSRWSPYH